MFGGCQPAKCLFRSFLVVLTDPCTDYHPSVVEADEPMLVQAFVAQPTIEGFDVRVLVGLARFDQAQANAVTMRPGQHGPAGELLAIVGSDDRWPAAERADLVQQAHQVVTANRMLRNHGDCLVCGVVNDCQALERPT